MTNMKPASFKRCFLQYLCFFVGGVLPKAGFLKFAEFWFRSTQMTFGQIRIMSDKDLQYFFFMITYWQETSKLICSVFPNKYALEGSFIFYGGFSCQNFCTTHCFRSSRSWNCCGPSNSCTSVIRSKCGYRIWWKGVYAQWCDRDVSWITPKYTLHEKHSPWKKRPYQKETSLPTIHSQVLRCFCC